MHKLSVLVSGKGSTLDNLAFHALDNLDGMIYGFVEINEVVADRKCPALDIAEHKWGLPVRVCERVDYDSDEEWSRYLLGEEHEIGDNQSPPPDLWVMAGFLSKIVVPERWKNRIINIHPSLLPAYGGSGMYGRKVHEAVVHNKEKITGCSVHVVDDEYDHGPIIGQIQVAVLPWDKAEDVEQAVRDMEKKLYPRAILNYLRGVKDK